MQNHISVVGVGSPIVDAIAMVDDHFLAGVPGDKGGMVLIDAAAISELAGRLPSPATRAPGGSAGNTLFALARLGASTRFVGKIGNCQEGTFYEGAFARLGGDTSRFKRGGIPNGRCLSLVTPDGERTMRTDLGAAMTLAPEEVTPADFEGCAHAHIEGYLLFNEALMRRVLESARTAGCTISLDLASFEVVEATRDILPSILRDYVDIVFANEEEGAAFTGIADDYPAMARELLNFCKVAAIKVGARGAYVAQGEQLEQIAPVKADRVIDTTGAGDLWAAGFLYGWTRGAAPAACGRIGALLGAAVVQEQGSVLPETTWESLIQTVTSEGLA